MGLWSDLLARFARKHDGWRPRPQASLYVRDGGIFIFSARASSAGWSSTSAPVFQLQRDAAPEQIGAAVLEALNAFQSNCDEQTTEDAGHAAVAQAGFRSLTQLERGAAYLNASVTEGGQAVIMPMRATLNGGYSGANKDVKSCALDAGEIGTQILALLDQCVPRGPFKVAPPPRPRKLDGLAPTPLSDVPVSFCYKETWLTISCDNPGKVAIALGLKDLRESTWKDAFHHLHKNRMIAFVCPSVGGWTPLVGHVPGPHLTEFKRILCDLSAQFGEAQYYGNHRVSNFYAWGRAREGQLGRLFYFADQLKEEVGPRTPEEVELNIGHLTEDSWPDEDDVLKIASRWSFNPADLGDQDTYGRGSLGIVPSAR